MHVVRKLAAGAHTPQVTALPQPSSITPHWALRDAQLFAQHPPGHRRRPRRHRPDFPTADPRATTTATTAVQQQRDQCHDR
jgi:hypothetical protein